MKLEVAEVVRDIGVNSLRTTYKKRMPPTSDKDLVAYAR